jgi:hypothetical protein
MIEREEQIERRKQRDREVVQRDRERERAGMI